METGFVMPGILYLYQALIAVDDAVRFIIAQINDPARNGGYFCLLRRRQMPRGTPELLVLIGEVAEEKAAKYLGLAQEKALRLAAHQEHISSWCSRDPESNKWGGAIRADHYYLSFSGLPEEADEAAMILAAIRLHLLTKEQAICIADKSHNQIFFKAVDHWIGGAVGQA